MQTQVLPYLREIGKRNPEEGQSAEAISVSLLTFEPRRGPADIAEFEKIRAELRAEAIEWDWLPYHKRPSALATAWDILRGALYIRRRIGKYDVLHGRVHVPTLMAAIARKLSFRRPKILFDIRGFMPEEYTDAGIWPADGLLYRTAKRVEQWLMKESDAFVVLTEKAREILFPESKETGFDKFGRPVEVIPCCVDLKRFAADSGGTREEMRRLLRLDDRKVLVYTGSFGGWYLTAETADCFGAFRRRYPNAFAMILTQSDPQIIEPLLIERGYSEKDFLIRKIPSAEMARYLSAADIAVSLIKNCDSKQSSSPTKNAEYLASGLPIIANRGVGDVDLLIEKYGVGALITDFDAASLLRAFEKIESLGDVRSRCREAAEKEFDLESIGGNRYRRLYSKITNAGQY